MGRCWLELELNGSWAEGCGIYPSVALSAPGQISTVCGALFSVNRTTLVSRVLAPRTSSKDEDSRACVTTKEPCSSRPMHRRCGEEDRHGDCQPIYTLRLRAQSPPERAPR
jgi:hypothetical protein